MLLASISGSWTSSHGFCSTQLQTHWNLLRHLQLRPKSLPWPHEIDRSHRPSFAGIGCLCGGHPVVDARQACAFAWGYGGLHLGTGQNRLRSALIDRFAPLAVYLPGTAKVFSIVGITLVHGAQVESASPAATPAAAAEETEVPCEPYTKPL